MSKKLSIIVPVYNVSNYLEECLESLLRQNIDNYEVIMVDDGSTDNSYEIVQEFEAKYSQFFGYTKPNQGLGHSRNLGAEMATGDYITFVDSDDIIPKGAYREMLETIEKTGSDFIIGNVIRFNSTKSFQSVLHTNVFRENYEKINIREHQELLYDTTAWNKIYQISFWKDNEFMFPEGMLYEDIPVTIPSHLMAKSVDVLTTTTYLWRARDEGDQSITQQRSSLVNLGDRLKAIQMVWDFMITHNIEEELKDAFDFKNLNMDFQIYLNYLKEKDPDFNKMLLDYLQIYLEHVSEETILKLSVFKRLKYRLLMNNRIDDFVELINKETNKEIKWKPVKKGENFYFEYPFMDVLTDEEQIANYVFEARTRIEKVNWASESILKLKGFAYIGMLDTSANTRFKISLFNETSGKEHVIESDYQPIKRKDVKTIFGGKTKSKNPFKRLYDYSFSGFDISINMNELENEFIDERNYVVIDIINDGVIVSKKLRSPVAGFISRPKYKVRNFIQISPSYNSFWEFKLAISQVDYLITKVDIDESDLLISGKENPKIKKSSKKLELSTSFPDLINLGNEIIQPSSVKINNGEFIYRFNKSKIDFTDKTEAYTLFGSHNYILNSDFFDKTYAFSPSKQIKTDYTNNTDLKLVISDYQAQIKNVFFEENQMTISVLLPILDNLKTDVSYVNLKFVDSFENEKQVKAISTKSVNDEAIFEFSMPVLENRVPIFSEKTYRLYLELPYEKEVINSFSGEIQNTAKLPVVFSNKGIDRFRYDKDSYRLEIRHLRGRNIAIFSQIKHWEKIEDGPRRQSFLRDILYPLMRLLPLKKIAVYESYWGKNYSCNPQALSEYIQENRSDIKNVVFLQDGFYLADGNVETVKINSFKYYYYLARAKYLVNNVNFPDFYKKRKKAIEIQTMHGTPLKRLGLDSPNEIKPHFVDKYIEKNNRWDHLLIPSDYVGEIAKSAFKYDKSFVKSGYPRNDKLFKDNNSENIANLKEKYDLPMDKKIVLYAPTWRTKGKFSLAMDIEKLQNELGEEFFILIKLHHFSQANFDLSGKENFVKDVSLNSDIRELYLLSDVLITDYSSVMFDFALLRKPMIFFVYDYEKYKDELRGFYFDFALEAPGKLAKTTDDLVSSLKDLNTYVLEYENKYTLFNEKFNQYDHGNACEIVVNQIF